jgi:hypothetical protein
MVRYLMLSSPAKADDPVFTGRFDADWTARLRG